MLAHMCGVTGVTGRRRHHHSVSDALPVDAHDAEAVTTERGVLCEGANARRGFGGCVWGWG